MEFEITEFISCLSTHAVYGLECPCGLMYFGRTKLTFAKKVCEHVYNILIGYKDHSVSLHFRQKHGRDPAGLKFWGIDKVHPAWRGGNIVRELSKCETQWIFLTNTLSPNGMNIDLDLNCFISDY